MIQNARQYREARQQLSKWTFPAESVTVAILFQSVSWVYEVVLSARPEPGLTCCVTTSTLPSASYVVTTFLSSGKVNSAGRLLPSY